MLSLLKFTNFQRNLIKFSTKSKKADVIKNLNYENKALYGPVIKDNKNSSKRKSKIKSEDSNRTVDDEPPVNSANNDSERYWLLENNSKKDNKFKTNENDVTISLNSTTKKSIKIESLSESLNEIKTKKQSTKKNTKNELKLFETNNQCESELLLSSNSNEIPFSENDLKNILKFPLISNDEYLTKNLLSTVHDDDDGNQLGSSKKFKYPSVGKILQATMSEKSRKALINWKLSKISELGEEGFLNLQRDLLQQGKLFHKALQDYLVSFETPTIDPSISGVWDSVIVALGKLQPKTELIEARIEHPYLKYCGIVDYVSQVRSNLSIIEWKKSNKIKDNINLTYDAPLQLCAYLGALNYDKNYSKINNNINCGYVIIAYNNGKPAEIHYLNEIQLQKYWNLWLKRLQEYWIRFRDGTLPEPI